MLKRLAFMLILIVTPAAVSWAQEPTPKPIPNAQKIHWHKYINKEFGFSVKYPDSYRPTTDMNTARTMFIAGGYFVWSDEISQTRRSWSPSS